MSYLILIAFGAVAGVSYRMSEIGHIWSNASWDYFWLKKRNIKIRPWVGNWLKGKCHNPIDNSILFWFNIFTFSFFKNGYHFFRNVIWMVVFPIFLIINQKYFWIDINLQTIAIFYLSRFIGMKIALFLIVKKELDFTRSSLDAPEYIPGRRKKDELITHPF